jgi:hypothetical protein
LFVVLLVCVCVCVLFCFLLLCFCAWVCLCVFCLCGGVCVCFVLFFAVCVCVCVFRLLVLWWRCCSALLPHTLAPYPLRSRSSFPSRYPEVSCFISPWTQLDRVYKVLPWGVTSTMWGHIRSGWNANLELERRGQPVGSRTTSSCSRDPFAPPVLYDFHTPLAGTLSTTPMR